MSHSVKDNNFAEQGRSSSKPGGSRRRTKRADREELEKDLRAARTHAERHIAHEKLRRLLRSEPEAWEAFEEDRSFHTV